jgi:hypothetical protein
MSLSKKGTGLPEVGSLMIAFAACPLLLPLPLP